MAEEETETVPAADIASTPEPEPMANVQMEEGEPGPGPRGAETFVDFVPPPRPPVPPPARHKLCVAIFITIYFVAWFAEESQIVPELMADGVNPPPGLSIFILFMIEIAVMVYCGVEVVVGLLRVKICGTWYGLLPWFQQPRCQWVKESDSVPMEILAIIVGIAEDGFKIFNPPKIPPPPPKVKVFDLIDKNKDAVLKSAHKINTEKEKEYDDWVENMKSHMETQPGFISCERESINVDTHTWLIKFKSVGALNNCMATPTWVKLVGELAPLLDAPKVTQILAKEPPINAFADMMTRQGESTPALPPKKWKTYVITLYSVYFSKLITDNTIGRYFVNWGWNPTFHPITNPNAADSSWSPEAFRLVSIASLVLTLNYITTPAIQLLVSEWMRRKPDEMDTKFPWKQLNDGVIPPIQIIGLGLYFMGTGIAWAQKI